MSIEAPSVFAAQQRERPSLCADFSWMFVGNAFYAAGQFAILVLLTKLVRPELVGQYALGLAWVYPVMMLTNMQLRSVMNSSERRQPHFGHYLGLRLLTTSAAFVIIFAITRVLRYRWELTEVILLVGLAYGLETISDVYYARLQLHDRMAEISKSLIARALFSVLALSVATYVTRSLVWGIAGVVLARAIVLFGYDIRERTHNLGEQPEWLAYNPALTPRFDLNEQRGLLLRSLPLGIVVLLTTLNSSIPSFFIKHGLGERDLGIFSAIGLTISVGNMAVVSLGQAAFTRLSRSYFNRDFAAFGNLLGKLLIIGAAIGVCGILLSKLAGREILTILFRPEYAERADLLPWIMAAGAILFMAQFLGFGLTAAGIYRTQVALNILTITSLVMGCYWLVARQGLLGVILSMLISAVVQLLASAIILFRSLRANACASAQELEAA
ncbi:MAG: oligosaccharide flippase family protein [Candidatus Acidiferrum sp.]